MSNDTNEVIIIPCINCICKPTCRHKIYRELFHDCILISRFLFNNAYTKYASVGEVYEALKPTTWSFDKKSSSFIVENIYEG